MLQLHIHTAMLCLYEPPVIDANLLSRLAGTLTSLTPNRPSALDIFYRSHAALRAWFEHWLSIPVHIYRWLPMPLCTQLIYGVTMLGRWARLVGPLKPSGPNGPTTIIDPSTDPSQLVGDLAAASTPTVPIRDSPDVPAAIAALREQLRSQPQLALDISAVLGAIGAQFKAADAMCADGGANIWDLCARKVLITRAKLEKWAEVVAAGGVDAVLAALVKGERAEEAEEEEHDDEGDQDVDADSMELQEDYLSIPTHADMYTDDIFGADFLGDLDPLLWFDGSQDWNASIGNAMVTGQEPRLQP